MSRHKPQSNVEDIRSRLLAAENSLKVVSFDVFDTLIQRSLPHPDYSKTPAAKALLAECHHSNPDMTLHAVLHQRNLAESTLRSQAAEQGLDPECHIRDVFGHWVSALELQSANISIEELMELELASDQAVSFATPGMRELIEELSGFRLKLVFTSDMYYSKAMIYRLLEGCGYVGCFAEGYVSSEIKKAKYSGELFGHILLTEHLASDELVHIGDNIAADVHGAQKCGLTAWQFRDTQIESNHTTQSFLRRLRNKNPFWEGASWHGLNVGSTAHLQRAAHDPLYRISFQYLGPLFTNFVHRVIRLSIEQETQLLLFCAREGFLLQSLYSLILSRVSVTNPPAAHYAFLNRKSVYTASLHSIGPRELEMGFHTTNPTLRNMLVRFSLPVDELADLAITAGFTDLDSQLTNPLESAQLKRLLAKPQFKAIVETHRRNSSEQLTDYLDSLGFWQASRVAIVDVGWNGTVQEALSVAFGAQSECPEIYGYYMAFLKRMSSQLQPAFNCRGIYHDQSNCFSLGAFHRFVELFETACRAPHPTVSGFCVNPKGELVPEFEDIASEGYKQEKADERWVATVQAAILDYCEDYLETLPFRQGSPEDESAYILYQVDRLLRFPTREEADLLTRFGHSEGFGQSLVYVPAERDGPGHEKSTRPPKHHRVLWPEAEIAKKGIAGLNHLFNAARLLKTRRY